jgi:hypothetical protein
MRDLRLLISFSRCISVIDVLTERKAGYPASYHRGLVKVFLRISEAMDAAVALEKSIQCEDVQDVEHTR